MYRRFYAFRQKSKKNVMSYKLFFPKTYETFSPCFSRFHNMKKNKKTLMIKRKVENSVFFSTVMNK